MSRWPATKARRVLKALQRIGWRVKREAGKRTARRRAGAVPARASALPVVRFQSGGAQQVR